MRGSDHHSRPDYPAPHRRQHRLRSRARSQLALGVLDVEVHGLAGDVEDPADRPVGLAGRDPGQNLALTLGNMLRRPAEPALPAPRQRSPHRLTYSKITICGNYPSKASPDV